MPEDIKVWTDGEAEKKFEHIEKVKGGNESFDLEFKEELCWEDTSLKKNTTQRAFSGFANTYGGAIVVGFSNGGEAIGIDEKTDIENHIITKLGKKIQPSKNEYLSSLFKVRYYEYKGKKILVIFIKKSNVPLQCDNGVYYYREQSQFIPIPHSMLEDKFRRSFEEEKNVFLVMDELKNLTDEFNVLVQQDRGFKIEFYLKQFFQSQESLYYFYKRHGLLDSVTEIIKPLRFLVSTNAPFRRHQGHVIGNARGLLEKLKEIKTKEIDFS